VSVKFWHPLCGLSAEPDRRGRIRDGSLRVLSLRYTNIHKTQLCARIWDLGFSNVGRCRIVRYLNFIFILSTGNWWSKPRSAMVWHFVKQCIFGSLHFEGELLVVDTGIDLFHLWTTKVISFHSTFKTFFVCFIFPWIFKNISD